MIQQGERFDLIIQCDVMIPADDQHRALPEIGRVDPAQTKPLRLRRTGGARLRTSRIFYRGSTAVPGSKPLTVHGLQTLVDTHIEAGSALKK